MVIIKKKYMRIMIFIIALGGFLPMFLHGKIFYISLAALLILLLGSFVMYSNLYYFQRFGFKYRPFSMTRYFQILSIVEVIGVLILTFPLALEGGQWVPFIFLWVIALLIPYQFHSIFETAKHHKEQDPTRCDFC